MPEKSFVVLYPRGKESGGPEALHQLVDMLRRQGHPAFLSPYAETANNDRVGTYSVYDAPEIQRVQDSPDVVVIGGEAQIARLAKYVRAQRVIWWLSIDSSYHFSSVRGAHNMKAEGDPPRPLASLAKKFRTNLRRGRYPLSRFHHVAQSHFAQSFIYAQAGIYAPILSDYTIVPNPPNDAPTDASRRVGISYNPSKGGALWGPVIANLTELGVPLVPIVGMSRSQVHETLCESRLYLDLGPQPGKDRLPREAALRGAAVLLARRGAALFKADFDLADDGLLDLRDKAAWGTQILRNYERWDDLYEQQAPLRWQVAAEQNRFASEVTALADRLIVR